MYWLVFKAKSSSASLAVGAMALPLIFCKQLVDFPWAFLTGGVLVQEVQDPLGNLAGPFPQLVKEAGFFPIQKSLYFIWP